VGPLSFEWEGGQTRPLMTDERVEVVYFCQLPGSGRLSTAAMRSEQEIASFPCLSRLSLLAGIDRVA
jgi:hypothetical protein